MNFTPKVLSRNIKDYMISRKEALARQGSVSYLFASDAISEEFKYQRVLSTTYGLVNSAFNSKNELVGTALIQPDSFNFVRMKWIDEAK